MNTPACDCQPEARNLAFGRALKSFAFWELRHAPTRCHAPCPHHPAGNR